MVFMETFEKNVLGEQYMIKQIEANAYYLLTEISKYEMQAACLTTRTTSKI